MAGPRLADYLQTRERELEAQRSNLLGLLQPIDAELAQIRKIRSLLEIAPKAGIVDLASDAILPDPPESPKSPPELPSKSPPEPSKIDMVVEATLASPAVEAALSELTIKQMILRALRDHFDKGASPSELRDYMRDAFGKEVDRNSISPQLARLRDDGMVDMLNDGKWKLSQNGKGIMRYGNTGTLSVGGNPAYWKMRGAQPKKKDDEFLD